jgi:phosphoribosylformimino-5-aminoimidazole carboxamide ribotide isomerase
MFEIIPAIDLRGGQCVRLLQGDYRQETVYGQDPVAMARRWQDEGATRLHVVDLDGARDGAPANLPVIAAIAKELSIPVQMGGGLRTREAIQSTLEAGVQRCILGTKAVQEPEWAQQMFAEFGDALILGLDARNGQVAVSGWQETSSVPAVHFAQTMQERGCHRIIFTDIGRDGMLSGPNLEAMQEMAAAVEIPVIASGGVHVAGDIGALKQIANLEGAIVGKALYEGTATMVDLLNTAKS